MTPSLKLRRAPGKAAALKSRSKPFFTSGNQPRALAPLVCQTAALLGFEKEQLFGLYRFGHVEAESIGMVSDDLS